RRRTFDAERAGPWPRSFTPDAGIHMAPHRLAGDRPGCQGRSTEALPTALFYAETFIDLPPEPHMPAAEQGADRVSLDDTVVLEPATRVWGIWGRFAVRVRLGRGRHRILARIGAPETSIRITRPSGEPLGVESSTDARPTYSLASPAVLEDPNAL